MVKKSRTSKRINILEGILAIMEEHEMFCEIVSRKNDTENQIQKALFLRLQKELPQLLVERLGISIKKAQYQVDKQFKWEQNTKTTVSNFPFFSTNHRPDAVFIPYNNLRIAFEIKKGNNGNALRSGIGQSIVYSTQFDFVLYFFVDTSPGCDIKSNSSAKKEKELIYSLWNNYNIKFIIV
ncbi:MAG: hypothetical protein ISS29_03855 [Candidatus Marinimicrobia bacterium]|nr:hypothetical protein [Candidatus Neomarinimicrobiota bacterium]